MSKNLTFVALFRTNFVEEKLEKVVLQPVKIEFFKGPRFYQVPEQVARKFPKDTERLVARSRKINLDDEYYIEIRVRTKEADVNLARRFCESHVDESISLLSLIYNFHLFDALIYKGWIIENETGVIGGWMQVSDEPKYTILADELLDMFSVAKSRIGSDKDKANRFELMARFLSKSLLYDLGEEKFLLLWTILEIYPMKDTSNIEPINICLAEILHSTPQLVKNDLGIGKLYGLRCALVHDGRFFMDMQLVDAQHEKDQDIKYVHYQSQTLAKLECIVREIMRYMCGMPYSGTLNQYL